MGACSTKVMDVIPDREVMLAIVNTIADFEDKLKKGQDLNKAQKKEMMRVQAVTNQMKKLVKTQKE